MSSVSGHKRSRSRSESPSPAKKKHQKDHKSKKSHKHKKDKEKSHKKKDKHSDKKRIKEAQKLLEFAEKQAASKNVTLISDSDYFQKATEFRVWLHKEKNKFIDEISTEDAHAYFKKFVKKWNSGELDDSYYKGIDHLAIDPATLTRHKWNFLSTMSESEKLKIQSVRDTVDTATQQHYEAGFGPQSGSGAAAAAQSERPAASIGPQRPPQSDPEMARLAVKVERKALQKDREVVLDELLPKATGRDAQIEKKKARAEANRAAQDAEPEYRESDLMGGSDSFAAAIARRNSRAEKKQAEKQQRVDQIMQNEKERMERFKQSMGLPSRFDESHDQ